MPQVYVCYRSMGFTSSNKFLTSNKEDGDYPKFTDGETIIEKSFRKKRNEVRINTLFARGMSLFMGLIVMLSVISCGTIL